MCSVHLKQGNQNVACLTCGQVASQDLSVCMLCDGSNGAILNLTDCSCSVGHYLVEKDSTGAYRSAGKICVQCPSDSYVPADNKYDCRLCPPNMVQSATTGLCVCVAGYDQVLKMGYCVIKVKVVDFCVATSTVQGIITQFSIADAATIKYWDVLEKTGSTDQTITSLTLEDLYLASVTSCMVIRKMWCY
jgi:hypothetical protein